MTDLEKAINSIEECFKTDDENMLLRASVPLGKIIKLRQGLQEAQSYKADAERYRWICANYDDFTLIQHDYEGSDIECMIDQAINESKPTKGVTHE